MIAFQYTKTDGAEYLSHLDVLRHIDRTLRRAGIVIKYSEGFSPHPRIFLNNPLGTGIKSVAEYGVIETDFDGDFKTLFNANAPKGLQCVDWGFVTVNPNFADSLTKCTYRATGITPFDVNDVLSLTEWVVVDSRGRTVDIRPRLSDLRFEGDVLYFTCGYGKTNLRPDLLCDLLCQRFGGRTGEILKTASHPIFSFNHDSEERA